MAKQVVSLDSDDFAAGGGIVEDNDVQVKSARWGIVNKSDYKETTEEEGAIPALILKVSVLDGDDPDKIETLIISAGDLNRLKPGPRGKTLISVGGAKLSNGSNAGIFLASLKDAGFDMAKASADVSVLDGVKMHLLRVAAPKRPGIVADAEEGGKAKRPQTVLTVTQLLDGKSKGKKSAAPAKPAKPVKKAAARDEDEDEDEDDEPEESDEDAGEESDEDEDDEDEDDDEDESDPATAATKYVTQALKKAKGKSLDVADVYPAAFALCKGLPPKERKPVVALLSDEDWLTDEARPWTSEDGTLSL